MPILSIITSLLLENTSPTTNKFLTYPTHYSAYNKATSDAEKALDKIIKMAGGYENDDIIFYVTSKKWAIPEKAHFYKQLVTQHLVDKLTFIDKKDIEENCNGIDNGEICGIDYNMILCSQDFDENVFYHTIQYDAFQSVISYNVPSYDSNNLVTRATYRMVKEQDKWKLDDIQCSD